MEKMESSVEAELDPAGFRTTTLLLEGATALDVVSGARTGNGYSCASGKGKESIPWSLASSAP